MGRLGPSRFFTGGHSCHPERSEGPLVLRAASATVAGEIGAEQVPRPTRQIVRQYYVYILTNRSHTLYTGVTNDLLHRVRQHKSKLIEGFTRKYNITRLVHYETFTNIEQAIAREKQIK